MKRLMLTALLLLLFSACGIPSDMPTPTSEQGHALIEPGVAEAYFPDLPFEIESVWCAMSYGQRGEAVLFMGEVDGDTIPVCVFTKYEYDMTPNKITVLEARALYGNLDSVTQTFIITEGTPAAQTVSGKYTMQGETLLLAYTEAIAAHEDGVVFKLENSNPRIVVDSSESSGHTQYLPIEFRRISSDDAETAMYDLPASQNEISACPNEGDTAFLYSEADYYYLSTSEKYAPKLRGLTIGDSIYDIIVRFPFSDIGLAVMSTDDTSDKEFVLYGNSYWIFNASLMCIDGEPAYITISAVDRVIYFLDENLNIAAIGYNLNSEDAASAWRREKWRG